MTQVDDLKTDVHNSLMEFYRHNEDIVSHQRSVLKEHYKVINVIAQYARDQAMGSARDQAAKVSLRRVDHYHGEHTPGICLESSKNGKLV